MRMWKIVLLALGGLRRTPLRVTLTALGVTIAAGALVSMVAFALGVQRQAETPFQALGLLNVIRVTPPKEEGSTETPILDDAALQEMESLPGVLVAFPDFRLTDVTVTHEQQSKKVTAIGLPRQVPLLTELEGIMIAGEYFSPGNSPELLLSRRLAADLGFDSPATALGAKVTLEASGLTPDQSATFKYEQKQLVVQVVGVFDVPGMLPGPIARTVLLPVASMKEIPGVRFAPALRLLRAGKDSGTAGYAKATVRVRSHVDLESVDKAIQEMGFRTRTMLSRVEEMRTFFVFIDVLLASVGTVALVVAGLGIVNTLLMSVLERYQEIGIYKAIGASDGDLAVLFLTEAGVIGLIGGLGGLLLGRTVAWLLEIAINTYARSQGVDTHLDVFAFPLWLLTATVLFAVLVSVLSGVYPALRAARIDPIRALRHE